MNFWFWADKQIFEQAGTFDMLIGQFWPIFEIQKIWNFQYFWANLATFFFKIGF
jgi:hypothetical protein